MTSRRALAAVALPVLLLAVGCGSSDDEGRSDARPTAATTTAAASTAAGSTASSTPTSSSPPSAAAAPTTPSPAGGGEAEVLSSLPAGKATGTAVLTYSGLGELRAPFRGMCAHDGDTTRLEGAADTAKIRLDVAPDGAQLALDDVGLSMTSAVATGRYDVAGKHLSLSAPLVSGDQSIGQVELEVDCGS